jgi:hypothetical protein
VPSELAAAELLQQRQQQQLAQQQQQQRDFELAAGAGGSAAAAGHGRSAAAAPQLPHDDFVDMEPFSHITAVWAQAPAGAVGLATAHAGATHFATAGSSRSQPPLPPEEAAIIGGLRSLGGWVNVDVEFTEPWLPGLPASAGLVNHLRIVSAQPGLSALGGDVVRFLAAHLFLP